MLNIFFHSKGFFAKFARFGDRILVILANLGVILGPIWEPGGRWGPLLDPTKNRPQKSRLRYSLLACVGAVLGSILESFLELFWHQFLDLVFGGLLAHFVVIFGPVLGPSGPLK